MKRSPTNIKNDRGAEVRYMSMCLAQLFMVIIGEYVQNKKHPLKKRYPILIDAISVFSSSDGMCVDNFLKGQSG